MKIGKPEKVRGGKQMGYKQEGIRCDYCGHDEFFVGTLGIEHCTECFGPRVEGDEG